MLGVTLHACFELGGAGCLQPCSTSQSFAGKKLVYCIWRNQETYGLMCFSMFWWLGLQVVVSHIMLVSCLWHYHKVKGPQMLPDVLFSAGGCVSSSCRHPGWWQCCWSSQQGISGHNRCVT
jgi:hypothetical protein